MARFNLQVCHSRYGRLDKVVYQGLPPLRTFSIFGDTKLWSVHDFDMELMFVMDKIQGNCSIYSMSIGETLYFSDVPGSYVLTDDGNHDNDDVWIHNHHILQVRTLCEVVDNFTTATLC